MKKLNTRNIGQFKQKNESRSLNMLTCYDFQTASLLNKTSLDLILVGDSVGNVILGYETTVEVTLDQMKLFGAAVRRGAPDKFLVVDMPFGSYYNVNVGLRNAIELFRETKAEALKIEGASEYHCELIKQLSLTGIPVMGHIGLQPQSVHVLGGYYTHGKEENSRQKLLREAKALEQAGAFSVVLECIEKETAQMITDQLKISTIGIGSGKNVDGQVLVLNDLLHMGEQDPPKFCQPIANFFDLKIKLIEKYLER